MCILQTNLGRSKRAQDLLYQTIRESTVALAVAAEPYRVLDTPEWVGDTDKMVAVTWTSTLGDYVRRRLPRQVLVLGDFNAHSTEWENARTNDALSNWAAGLGLLLVNRGSTSTCVAWRGSSIVDITWASPDALWRISD
ncbi:uncharacterized protein LOC117152159 [Bombus impatiens]|uniref:Uncharacterized protein LOC117152159 n=1 Tax=Bombus impatiens TaxID=132113 RepID=A0A6P8LIW6_BOMIM|nr:uncharacterized protein LOC117152159 [Bombus impatiens]